MKTTIFATLFSLFVSTQAHAWVIKSDFEDGKIGELANTGKNNAFSRTVFSDENPHSGKKSAKATVSKGSTGSSEWGMIYNLPKAYEGEEIWFRAWLYFPPQFHT